MKRKKFIPLAITMLLAVPAFLTSCQEDAPEINYTMSVSVINDFTKVVESIDRGALKNEEAIAKLADAIDRMSPTSRPSVMSSARSTPPSRPGSSPSRRRSRRRLCHWWTSWTSWRRPSMPFLTTAPGSPPSARPSPTCLPPAAAENPGSAMSAGVTTGRVRSARPTATTPATSTSVRADTTGTSIPCYYGFSVRPVRP